MSPGSVTPNPSTHSWASLTMSGSMTQIWSEDTGRPLHEDSWLEVSVTSPRERVWHGTDYHAKKNVMTEKKMSFWLGKGTGLGYPPGRSTLQSSERLIDKAGGRERIVYTRWIGGTGYLRRVPKWKRDEMFVSWGVECVCLFSNKHTHTLNPCGKRGLFGFRNSILFLESVYGSDENRRSGDDITRHPSIRTFVRQVDYGRHWHC